MLKNIVKIAIRCLLKDIKYSSINVLGLTIGITSSLLLLFYILDELSFDRYHKNAANIYRVISHTQEPENSFTWPVTQAPLSRELIDHYPEVINAARFFATDPAIYKSQTKQFSEDLFFRADPTVFDIFSYKFLAGNTRDALEDPFSIVLTKKIAAKYFTDVPSAIGQTLQNQNGQAFTVTGVI